MEKDVITETENKNLIYGSILRDMSEGVLAIGLDGIIGGVNPAAEEILERKSDELAGKSFAKEFFEYEENDGFNQLILDAIYDSENIHKGIVPYYTGKTLKQLGVTTSYLKDNGRKVAVIAVINDISEIMELRDAVKAMERIRSLNSQLEIRNKLLSETFGRFLSDEIVRQLLDTPDGLAMGGKKAVVTVVMSDLRGFTAMCEHVPAQDMVTLLNHYLGEMTEIIERRGGTIIEFLGDGILSVFGAPVATDKHAENAVAAAVEMEHRMEKVNMWNYEHGFPVLEMGIGINSGEVIVGNIGSERRTKYGVVGSLVNLCGRIESYTTGGQILIGPNTRAAIGAELDIADETEVMPKGVKAPIVLTKINGIGAPYNLSCKVNYEEIVDFLEEPVEFSFRKIDGKHIDSEMKKCRVLAYTSQCACIETKTELKVFDNIEIEAEERVFAKVIGTGDRGIIIRYTSGSLKFD